MKFAVLAALVAVASAEEAKWKCPAGVTKRFFERYNCKEKEKKFLKRTYDDEITATTGQCLYNTWDNKSYMTSCDEYGIQFTTWNGKECKGRPDRFKRAKWGECERFDGNYYSKYEKPAADATAA